MVVLTLEGGSPVTKTIPMYTRALENRVGIEKTDWKSIRQLPMSIHGTRCNEELAIWLHEGPAEPLLEENGGDR